MHRDINQTAAVLGLNPHYLRKKLREIGVLTETGDLQSKHHGGKNFFLQPSRRWNTSLMEYLHYDAIMITGQGVSWIARQLAINARMKSSKNVA